MKIDKRDIFIKGKDIFLKALRKEDIVNSNWYGWFNDEEICKTLQKHYFPNTLEFQLEYFEKFIFNKNDKIQLGICKYNLDKLLGIVSLNNIDYLNRKAELSVLIGEPEGRDTITIVEVWKLILNHGFNTLNLIKIYAGTMQKELCLLMKN